MGPRIHLIQKKLNKNSKTPRNYLRLQGINHGLYVLPTANRDVWRSALNICTVYAKRL